jgi:hypothetical protein
MDMLKLAELAELYRLPKDRRTERQLHALENNPRWDLFWSLGALCAGPR